jgi:hypothetical protein
MVSEEEAKIIRAYVHYLLGKCEFIKDDNTREEINYKLRSSLTKSWNYDTSSLSGDGEAEDYVPIRLLILIKYVYIKKEFERNNKNISILDYKKFRVDYNRKKKIEDILD